MKKTLLPARHPLDVRLHMPGSKSLTNRGLLLAALAHGVSELSDILLSDDTETLIEALRNLGVAVQVDTGRLSCLVTGCGGLFPAKKARLFCRQAGTVARFLLAACCASPGEYHFDAAPGLRRRPLAGLVEALRSQGVKIHAEDDHLPLTVWGQTGLKGGTLEIDASKSGQFVSALLMAAPLSRRSVMLNMHQPVSRPFIDMTLATMAEFGVRVRQLHPERFSIPVPQRYLARHFVAEPDLSTAAPFFAAAAVLAGEVSIQPVDPATSVQGDAAFLSLLQKMGCEVHRGPGGLTVRGTPVLRGINADLGNCSDTFMALAAIAPFATGPTTLTNIGHTRRQECDRIHAMAEGLTRLGIHTEQGPDWLRIHPGQPSPGEIDAHGDHRIAMAFAVAGLRAGIQIDGAECVSKTCPGFFGLWEQLKIW